jgi:hypothetical protein
MLSISRARTPYRLQGRRGLTAALVAAGLLLAGAAGSLRPGDARREPVPTSHSVAIVAVGGGGSVPGLVAGSHALITP